MNKLQKIALLAALCTTNQEIIPSSSSSSSAALADSSLNARPQLKPEEQRDLDSALLIAAARGDITQATQLIGKGANVNSYDDLGRSPIVAAAINNYAEMIEILHAQGCDIDSLQYKNKAPLTHALNENSYQAALKLVKLGANPHARDNQSLNNALHYNKNTELFDILLSKGVDVNARNIVGQTPLDTAISINIGKLITHGANVNEIDSKGDTKLHQAFVGLNWNNSYIEMIDILLDYDADLEITNCKGEKPVNLLTNLDARKEYEDYMATRRIRIG